MIQGEKLAHEQLPKKIPEKPQVQASGGDAPCSWFHERAEAHEELTKPEDLRSTTLAGWLT